MGPALRDEWPTSDPIATCLRDRVDLGRADRNSPIDAPCLDASPCLHARHGMRVFIGHEIPELEPALQELAKLRLAAAA